MAEVWYCESEFSDGIVYSYGDYTKNLPESEMLKNAELAFIRCMARLPEVNDSELKINYWTQEQGLIKSKEEVEIKTHVFTIDKTYLSKLKNKNLRSLEYGKE